MVTWYNLSVSALLIIALACLYYSHLPAKLCFYIKDTKKGVFWIVGFLYLITAVLVCIVGKIPLKSFSSIFCGSFIYIIFLTSLGLVLAFTLKKLAIKSSFCNRAAETLITEKTNLPPSVSFASQLSEPERELIAILYREEKRRSVLMVFLNFSISFVIGFLFVLVSFPKIFSANPIPDNSMIIGWITIILSFLAICYPLHSSINQFVLNKKSLILNYYLNQNRPDIFLTLFLDLERKANHSLFFGILGFLLGFLLVVSLA